MCIHPCLKWGGRVAVHLRHLNVHQDGIVTPGSRRAKRLYSQDSIALYHNFRPAHLQDLTNNLRVDCIVLRN